MLPIPASTRKCERLEKQTPTTPPVKRKLMTVEKYVPNALRRSERGNKQSSSSSSGSKKSHKSSASSGAKKPKEKKEKSVKQLLETRETEFVQKKKKKTWSARTYLTFFEQNGSDQVNASDQGKKPNRLDEPDSNMPRGKISKQVHRKPDHDKDRSKLMEEYVQRPLDVVLEDSYSSLNTTGVGISTPSPKLIQGGKDGDGLQKVKSDESAHADCTLYKKMRSPELPESTVFGMTGDANVSLVATHKVASLKRKRDLDMDLEGKRTETCGTYLKRQSMSQTSHIECEGGRTVRDAQESLYLHLKPEISKLCEALQLSEEIKGTVEKFFEYVMNNHSISKEPSQAFQISLCWIAASLLNKKIDRKQSLVLAKQHLNFCCNEEEATHVYLKLRCLKHLFLYRSCYHKIANSSRVSSLSSKDEPFGRPDAANHQQEDIVDQSRSVKGLVEKDISKTINLLQKKCDKQLSNLIIMQHEELNEVYRSYEEAKVELEKKHTTELAVIRCLDRSSAGLGRLKILENGFASKIEQQKQQFNTSIADLMERQNSAREKVKQKFAHLEDDVNSWLKVELLNRLPSDELGCVLEKPQMSEEPYPGNAPLVQSGCTLLQGDPLHLSQAFQDQCSLPSISTVMQDGDKPGSKEGKDAGQGEAPQSLPNEDTVQSNCNFEAPTIEPVVQSQLSPTDTSPNENPLDLSLAGEIGLTPSTLEPNGRDIEAQYVGCHEASLMETLHGHVLQDQRTMPSLSTEKQDEDAQSIKERHVTEQVEVPQSSSNDDVVPYVDEPSSKEGNDAGQGEAPQSLPNDDTVQSDCNFEAPTIEPVVQSQLSPTDTSPNENQLDLSSAGEIGLAPSTQEQSGRDIDHEASVMETIHGHALQDQRIMPSLSTEDQDRDAPGIKERHGTEQVEVPQSNSNDDAVPYAVELSSKEGNDAGQGEAPQSHPNGDYVQSDYNFETPTIEPIVQQDKGEPSSKERNITGQGEAPQSHPNDNTVQSDYNFEAPTIEPVVQDGDELSRKAGNISREDEAPQSHPKDDTVQSDYNFEAPIVEPVVQSQLSPTDTSPNENPHNLSSAGEIGHPPITQELSGTHNDVQSGGNCEVSVTEPAVHVSPTDFSSGHNPPDLPSSGEAEYQTRTEDDLSSGVEIEYQHSNEVQNVIAEVEPPSQSQSMDALPSEHRIHETVVREPVLQLQLPASIDSSSGHNPLLASRPLGDDPQRRQMQPTHAGSRMPLPLSLDPLQNLLDRIRKDMDHSVKIYEDETLQLKADREKEIEEVVTQIHKKYEIKLQESEVEFSRKKKEMDASYNKILMNKILAEAFRCKCMDDRASGVPGIQQDIVSSLRQQTGQRSPSFVTATQHPTVTSHQSSTLPAASLHVTASPQQPIYYSRPLVSTPTVSSLTSPISHPAMSSQGGSGIRAPGPPILTSPISHPAMSRQGGSVIRSPAPHLKRFRPPASPPLSSTLSLPFELPSQQPPNTVTPPSIPMSSSSLLPHPLRMPSQQTPNTVNYSTPLSSSGLHPVPCRMPSQLTPNTTSYPSTPLSSTSLPPLPSRMSSQRTPNYHPAGPSSPALNLMNVNRRHGATLPDILSTLPDLGFSGLGLHGSHVGAQVPRASSSSSGDVVCLSDDD